MRFAYWKWRRWLRLNTSKHHDISVLCFHAIRETQSLRFVISSISNSSGLFTRIYFRMMREEQRRSCYTLSSTKCRYTIYCINNSTNGCKKGSSEWRLDDSWNAHGMRCTVSINRNFSSSCALALRSGTISFILLRITFVDVPTAADAAVFTYFPFAVSWIQS